MGIEPTDHMISMRPSDFEDRGLHQQSKHFQRNLTLKNCSPVPFACLRLETLFIYSCVDFFHGFSTPLSSEVVSDFTIGMKVI